MTPEYQTIFNIALVLAGTFGGWVLKSVSASVRDLQNADKELADKVSHIAVQVAGDYVPRTEFQRTMTEVFQLLRRIDDKLDRKADRATAEKE